MAISLFGYEIKRSTNDSSNKIESFVDKEESDGALAVQSAGYAAGGLMTGVLDLNGAVKTESELITKYRSMLQQPEVNAAVDDIINEAIHITYEEEPVICVTDELDVKDTIKKKIREEFENILALLDFSNNGYEIFQRWYVDGRLKYHVILHDNPKNGIKELRYIDPRKLRLIKEYETTSIGPKNNTALIKNLKNEYYMFMEKGFFDDKKISDDYNYNFTGLKIAKDSIVECNSGLLNETNTLVLSHLHKAYKILNQLRMIEDAVVIYRIVRAPERRVFYIDIGNLPKAKAEQYLKDMMTMHKNRLVYDTTTGNITDDRRTMAMTDDFWMPRREGGRGTQIDTLPAGQNLGEMDDVAYFQKKLYKALNVPISRLESETGFSLGRASEISRDEIKFSKFIRRLRVKFSILFDKLLEQQLILKGIITPEEWTSIKSKLKYDFVSDNYFEELKLTEIMHERINMLRDMDEYTGKYYSQGWIKRHILRLSEDEITDIKKEIEKEKASGELESDDDFDVDDGDEDKPTQRPAPPTDNPDADAEEELEFGNI